MQIICTTARLLVFMSLKKCELFSCAWLFVTPWTVAPQAPLSMGFSRQEYWSGVPLPSLGIFSTQGLNLGLWHCKQTLHCLSHQGSPKSICLYFSSVFFFSYHNRTLKNICNFISCADEFLINNFVSTMINILFILYIGRWSCIVVIHLWQVVKNVS